MMQNILIPETVVHIVTTYVKRLRNKPYSRRIYTLSFLHLKMHRANGTDIRLLLVSNIISAI
jgi:hypothetical protein